MPSMGYVIFGSAASDQAPTAAVGTAWLPAATWWGLVCLLCAVTYLLFSRLFMRNVRGQREVLFVALALVTVAGSMVYAESHTFAIQHPLFSLPLQVLFLLFFYLFAERRFAPSRARWLTILFVFSQLGTLSAGKQSSQQPVALLPAGSWILGVFAVLGDMLSVTIIVAAIVFQVYGRYRALVAYTATGKQSVSRTLLIAALAGGALLLGVSALFGASAQANVSLAYLLARTAFYLVAMLVPVAAAYALLAAPRLDRQALLRRATIFSLLTLSFLGIFAACMAALALAVPGFVSFSALEYLPFVILVAILFWALFRSLRTQIQDMVDRSLFPALYEAQHSIAAFRSNLTPSAPLGQLGEQLVTATVQAFDAEGVALWLATALTASQSSDSNVHFSLRCQTARGRLEQATIGSVEVGERDPLLRWLAAPAHFVALEGVDGASQALATAGVTHILTFPGQHGLVGLLGLGARASGRGYTADDAELLVRLAGELAPTLQAATDTHRREVEERERERVEQELQTARRIQESLLPKEIPALDGWQIAARYQPAREVGGDFYDFMLLADGRLGVVLGDVTDKGIPAALVMATTRSMLRAAAQPHVTPGEVLAQVNDLLCRDLPSGMFVTCFYAILDPATGAVTYANAGQDPPFLRRCDSDVGELYATGMPLGLMPGMRYDVCEGTVARGESLLFFSDGLVEAHNRSRDMFGLPRVRTLLGNHDEHGTAPPIAPLLHELATFTGPEWEQEDDITLVFIQRLQGTSDGTRDDHLARQALAAVVSGGDEGLT